MITSVALLASILATATAAPFQDNLDNRLLPQNEEAPPVSTETEIVATNDETRQLARRQTERIAVEDPSTPTTSTSEQSNETSSSESGEKPIKRGRKHKAIFVDYPFVPQVQFPGLVPYDLEYDYDPNVEQRSPGGAKRYQESNIFYIRLPPTPYMFVPGLGYISQPPTYSTSSLRPQIPYARPGRPKPVYQQPGNPFINLPIDFVSNGKPTAVYQWQKKPSKKPTDSPITNLDSLSADFVSNGKPTTIYQWQTNLKPVKRPDDLVNNLDKGPYVFNGKPASFFLLKSDGTTSQRRPIRYTEKNDSYYRGNRDSPRLR